MNEKILNELLYSNLLNREQKDCILELYSDLEHESTDAVYWKDKYYGTWPRDSVESIQNHIKLLQKRIEELKNGKQNS